ncbi:hypothetical protein [Mycobacterium sp. OTB74]|jgi:hypothetical protein|uniref:hypothetical protein n=1 Tax=Mycobacterium sp. OTB74 TaxID=1853452 RepID=UPI002472FF34|nr:hypothetical protein [Mycobacterium sp. OTB74]MDH6247993.1 hypothetical protein [Mycobacterium sp. OTB74]
MSDDRWRVTVSDGFHPRTEAIEVWYEDDPCGCDGYGKSISLWMIHDGEPCPLFDMQQPGEAAELGRALIAANARMLESDNLDSTESA